MFRLPGPDDTFPTACTIEAPDGDRTVECEITIHFRVLPVEEYDRLARESLPELMTALIGGWDGVAGADGKPLSCTADNIRLAAGIPYFARGVLLGYAGRFSALKNYRAPLAG